MKIFLSSLLLVCLIGQTNAVVSKKLLDKAWFVLPWESIREHKGDITIDDIKELASFDILTDIKKSKLPDRLTQKRVDSVFRVVWKKWPGARPVDENEWPGDINFSEILEKNSKHLKISFHRKMLAQDIFFVLFKKKETPDLYDIHIVSKLYIEENSRCDDENHPGVCCSELGYFLVGAGICVAIGCGLCAQFLT